MCAAVVQAEPSAAIHEQLAGAARHCLQAALARPAHRAAALDLLAADALLTHACAAAADAGPEELARFSASLDAAHFDELLK